MKLSMVQVNKRPASLLICVLLLLSSLPSWANAATVSPIDTLSPSPDSSTVIPPLNRTAGRLKGNAQLSESIVITLQTPPYQITASSDGFDLVQVDGFDHFGAPGDPALPGKIYNIAVPPDIVWESVTVELLRAETIELPGTYEIAPAPPPATWVEGRQIVAWGENAASIVDGKNTKVYQNNAYFPSSYATSIAQSQMRKWRFVRLLFTPVQYNPTTQKLRMATEVTGVLDNNHPAFVYQCSCLNGYPENSANLGCALLKQGAIATVSASRVSWYAIGSWSPNRSYADNATIGYYFMQQIANEERVGKALYEEKEAMGTDWEGSSWMNLWVSTSTATRQPA